MEIHRRFQNINLNYFEYLIEQDIIICGSILNVLEHFCLSSARKNAYVMTEIKGIKLEIK